MIVPRSSASVDWCIAVNFTLKSFVGVQRSAKRPLFCMTSLMSFCPVTALSI